jgi:uncharacterized protein (TIGR02118 family)
VHRLTILYDRPDDPDAFRRYYYETHIPLARRMRGLTGWNLSWIEDDQDGASRYLLVCELYAETSEHMDAILASPEGRAASDDLTNFVTAPVDFLRGDEEQVELS